MKKFVSFLLISMAIFNVFAVDTPISTKNIESRPYILGASVGNDFFSSKALRQSSAIDYGLNLGARFSYNINSKWQMALNLNYAHFNHKDKNYYDKSLRDQVINVHSDLYMMSFEAGVHPFDSLDKLYIGIKSGLSYTVTKYDKRNYWTMNTNQNSLNNLSGVLGPSMAYLFSINQSFSISPRISYLWMIQEGVTLQTGLYFNYHL